MRHISGDMLPSYLKVHRKPCQKALNWKTLIDSVKRLLPACERMCYSITQIRESGSTEYLVAIQWKIQKSKPRSMTRPPNLKGQVVCCAIKICAGKKERPQAGGQSLVGAIMLCENLCGSRNAHKCEITYESTKYQVQKRRRQSQSKQEYKKVTEETAERKKMLLFKSIHMYPMWSWAGGNAVKSETNYCERGQYSAGCVLLHFHYSPPKYPPSCICCIFFSLCSRSLITCLYVQVIANAVCDNYRVC